MDRDQTQYGSLGLKGIYRETFRIIFTWKKILSQITLALILPLFFLIIAYAMFTDLFFGGYRVEEHNVPYGSGEYQVSYGHSGNGLVSFYIFTVVYVIIWLLLSLLSTAVVVYTIACIYANKDHTFSKVMTTVPKAWKRLIITFLWSFPIYLIFAAVSILLFLGCAHILMHHMAFGIVLSILLFIAFVVSYLYIIVIVHLAYVVSILEDDYGRKAIAKGTALVKGKFWAAATCYLISGAIFASIVKTQVGNLEIWLRILIGVALLVLLLFLYLTELVYQTVIYFVCKSYHNEHIDGLALAHHLEPANKDVQLEPANRWSIHVEASIDV